MSDLSNIINHLISSPNNLVVTALIISIAIVFISIVYVLLQSSSEQTITNLKDSNMKKKSIKKESQTIMGKTNKTKYTKEFLKRVKGLDLELKESNRE